MPDPESDDEEEAHDEGEGLAVYMAKFRAKFQEAFPTQHALFRVAPRGGKSNAKKGVIFDCVRSEAYSELGLRWCHHYGLPKSFDVFYLTCDGPRNASVIAHAHFQKMCHLSGLWMDAGMGQLAYTDAMLAEHTEPADFMELAAAEDTSAGCRRRIGVVRGLRPQPWRPVPH